MQFSLSLSFLTFFYNFRGDIRTISRTFKNMYSPDVDCQTPAETRHGSHISLSLFVPVVHSPF